MTDGRIVAILGAGTGGLVAASRLRRMLGKEHRVILIDRSPIYYFAPSFTWVMTGARNANRIGRDLRGLEKKGIEFVTAEISGIDAPNKRLLAEGMELYADYLVIALGAEYSAEDVPGLHRAWTFYHIDGAEGLSEELAGFRGGRIAIVVGGLPIKCPPALYEGAFLIDDHLRRRKLRDDVQIDIYTPETAPLEYAGDEASALALELMAKRGIGFHGGVQAKSVNHEKKLINFTDGPSASFDLLVGTPIHKVPKVLIENEVSHGGWLEVDRETLATEFERVYAIGDVNTIPLESGHTLPKAGVFAHGQAEVVARNISAEINGGQPIWAFGGQGACFMETGGGKGCYIEGNFYLDPPEVKIRGEGRFPHYMKSGFERIWLWRWF